MNSIDFCYWLQGYFEINGEITDIKQDQAQVIQNHLNLVFKHEIDALTDNGDLNLKLDLQDIHDKNRPGHSRPNPLGNDTLLRC